MYLFSCLVRSRSVSYAACRMQLRGQVQVSASSATAAATANSKQYTQQQAASSQSPKTRSAGMGATHSWHIRALLISKERRGLRNCGRIGWSFGGFTFCAAFSSMAMSSGGPHRSGIPCGFRAYQGSQWRKNGGPVCNVHVHGPGFRLCMIGFGSDNLQWTGRAHY